MRIHIDSTNYVTEVHNDVCDFHKKYPGLRVGSCGCSLRITQRLATPDERKANIEFAKKRTDREAQACREFPGVDMSWWN